MSEAAGSKRSGDGDDWGGKRTKGDTVTLRFLLFSKPAGGIIGKSGETIKRLRTEFSARVTVPDTSTNERVLSIATERERCIEVLKECLPLMQEPPYPVNTGAVDKEIPFQVDFLVHSSQVGGIIGRGGSNIKKLIEDTNVNIKVYHECLPDSTERVVAIGGETEQIVAALNKILDVMQEQPIKGNISLYDPSYDHTPSFGANNYNNNFDGSGRMGGGMRGSGMRGGGMRGGGMRGGGMRDGGMRDGGMRDGGMRGGGMGGGGMRGGGMRGGDMSSGGMGDNFGPGGFNPGSSGGEGGFGGGGVETTQVTIPNDLAGAIIGKGGERIRNIRQRSCADIKFADAVPGKNDRVITITGNPEQIQYAQFLMQQSVRQYSGKAV